MREVVVVQVGPEANRVGAHFWNAQDEAAGAAAAGGAAGEVAGGAPDPGALLRGAEGGGRGGGEVWTPRLVAVDLRGCRGAVRLSAEGGGGGGQGTDQGGGAWDGPAVTYAAPRIERNAFLRCLDEEEPEDESWEDEDYGDCEDSSDEESGEAAGAGGRSRGGKARGTYDWDAAELYPSEEVLRGGGAVRAGAGPHEGTGADFQVRLEEAAAELEADAQHWTHYLKAVLNHRNLHELPGLWQGAAAFEGFGEGVEAARREESLEAVVDNVRFFLEECDLCQGFQASVDAAGGFAGVGSVVLEALRDDFGGKIPLFVTEMHTGDRGDAEALQVQAGAADGGALLQLYDLNRGMALAAATRMADCLVPLWSRAGARVDAHFWSWDDKSPFQRSAALAVALDCVTLPYRVAARPRAGPYTPAGQTDMNGLIEAVRGPYQSPLAAAAVGLPLAAVGKGEPLPLGRSLLSFTPGVAAAPDGAYSEFYMLRGLRREGKTMRTAGAVDFWEAEMRAGMAKGVAGPCMRGICSVAQPLLAPLTFPTGVFSPRVGKRGDLSEEPAGLAAPSGGDNGAGATASTVHSCPAASKLHGSSKAWVPLLQSGALRLKTAAAKGGGQRLLRNWGVETDSLNEDLEIIHDLVHLYTRDSYLSSGESDND